MPLTKHSIDRAVERLVDTSKRKLNKKQKIKARESAKKIVIADINDYFAYFNTSPFERYIYSQLDINNQCVKVVEGFEGNIVTVIRTNFYNELKNNRGIKFIQRKLDECYALSETDQFLFIYTYPVKDKCLKYKIYKKGNIILEYYYVLIEREKQIYNLKLVEDLFYNRDEDTSLYLNYGLQVKLDYKKGEKVKINISKYSDIDWGVES